MSFNLCTDLILDGHQIWHISRKKGNFFTWSQIISFGNRHDSCCARIWLQMDLQSGTPPENEWVWQLCSTQLANMYILSLEWKGTSSATLLNLASYSLFCWCLFELGHSGEHRATTLMIVALGNGNPHLVENVEQVEGAGLTHLRCEQGKWI